MKGSAVAYGYAGNTFLTRAVAQQVLGQNNSKVHVAKPVVLVEILLEFVCDRIACIIVVSEVTVVGYKI